MFGRTPKVRVTKVDPVMDQILIELAANDPMTEKYSELLQLLERAAKIPLNERKTIDPNTIVVVAGNVFIAVFIVGYERMHIATSKAWNSILK